MKKKVFKLVLCASLVFAFLFSLNLQNADAQSITHADDEGRPKQCVCKGDDCEEGARITLRKKCGTAPCTNNVTLPGGHSSNSACL